jgi:hypothetical protein
VICALVLQTILTGGAMAIPLVDISSETSRQIIVDREPGQYLGHVTTVTLDDGKTIIAVYPKGHGRGAIVMKKSRDGGKTWSERLPTPANWTTSLEVPTIYKVKDPATRKTRLLLWSGLYPARIASSDDQGKTWTPLEKVGDWGGIVVMASQRQLPNGDILAWFHDDGRFMTQGAKADGIFRLYQVRSTDGGRTWEKPRELFRTSETNLCEPGLVVSPDGKRMALLLRENARRKNSHVTFSYDDGLTWTEPKELPETLTGDRHTAAYLKDGRLFVTFRDTAKDSPTVGDWVAWVGTWEDIVNGRPGQYRVRLMDNRHDWDCAYPGLEVMRDGTIVTTTYGTWTAGEPPYIVCVRVKPSELDRRLRRP